MSDTATSCLSIIGSMLFIVALFCGCLFFKYYKCHTQAEMQGFECSWGPLQGCMVKQNDGSWIDYDRLRYMN